MAWLVAWICFSTTYAMEGENEGIRCEKGFKIQRRGVKQDGEPQSLTIFCLPALVCERCWLGWSPRELPEACMPGAGGAGSRMVPPWRLKGRAWLLPGLASLPQAP